MASPIPESMIYQLLAKFPSQSYKIVEKEFTPHDYSTNGVFESNQSIKFNISAAPNEFAFTDDAYLCAGLYAEGSINVQNWEAYGSSKYQLAYRPGMSWIGSVKESVNNGSMITYDLSNKTASNWYNCMRGVFTKTPIFYKVGAGSYVETTATPRGTLLPSYDIYGAVPDADYIDMQDIARAGFCNRAKRRTGINTSIDAGGGGTNDDRDTGLKNGFRNVEIPLSALGSIWQSTTCLPIGLFSNYSDSAYSLEVSVANINVTLAAPNAYSEVGYFRVVKPKITVKFLRVLDNQLMDAIMSLYTGAQVEVVENVKQLVSLQLNTLKYTFHQFTLDANAQEYMLNVPCSSPSLRGFCFRIVRTTTLNDISADDNFSGVPLADTSDWSKKAVVTKFHFKAGSECIMPNPVEKENLIITNNNYEYNPCPEFFAKQARKCGHLFSLLNHKKQSKMSNHGLEQFYGDGSAPPWLKNLSAEPIDYFDFYAPVGYMSCMSLENMTPEDNNGNVACGLDMRDIGSYQLSLRVGVLDDTTVNGRVQGRNGAITKLLPETYTLLLINVEDQVLSVSKSGVSDITSSVL